MALASRRLYEITVVYYKQILTARCLRAGGGKAYYVILYHARNVWEAYGLTVNYKNEKLFYSSNSLQLKFSLTCFLFLFTLSTLLLPLTCSMNHAQQEVLQDV